MDYPFVIWFTYTFSQLVFWHCLYCFSVNKFDLIFLKISYCWSSFRFVAELIRRYRGFRIPCPGMCATSPTINIPHHDSAFVTVVYNLLNSWWNLMFAKFFCVLLSLRRHVIFYGMIPFILFFKFIFYRSNIGYFLQSLLYFWN